jgi:LmbE family N-acetylglucosaminyl deacetylase
VQKNTTVDIGQTLETLLLEAIDYWLPHANLISMSHDEPWPAPDHAELTAVSQRACRVDSRRARPEEHRGSGAGSVGAQRRS